MNTITLFLEKIIAGVGLAPEQTILGNTVLEYALAVVVLIAFLIVFKIVQVWLIMYFKKLANKTETDLDDTLVEIVKGLKPPFYSFVAFYLAIKTLTITPAFDAFINAVFIIWVIYEVIYALQILVTYFLTRNLTDETDAASRTAFTAIGRLVKGALWAVGGLMILSNLGVDVSSLIAGLGIGGIAIAFALQNILTDLFSSFAIYFDKPFLVGDFIVVGSNAGAVEKIGIKSTRIRSITGEELVISNKELTSARIQNFKRLVERRLAFTIGVLYETSPEKLKKIPDMIEKIVAAQPKARFDRAHFKEFADSALNFEVVYYTESDQYGEFMDIRQAINMALFEKFEKEGIGFAYPTQTIHVEK